MNNKGTMEQKNKLIPELRFPEFVNDGVWGFSGDEWPNGVTELPDFPILNSSDFTKIFRQVQLDAASIIGIELTNPFQFSNPL